MDQFTLFEFSSNDQRSPNEPNKKRRKIAHSKQHQLITSERELKKRFVIYCLDNNFRLNHPNKEIMSKWEKSNFKEENLSQRDFFYLTYLFNHERPDFLKDTLAKLKKKQLIILISLRENKLEEYIKCKYKSDCIESCFSLLRGIPSAWKKRSIEIENMSKFNMDQDTTELVCGDKYFEIPLRILQYIFYYLPFWIKKKTLYAFQGQKLYPLVEDKVLMDKNRHIGDYMLNIIGIVSETWYFVALTSLNKKKFKLRVKLGLERIPYPVKKAIRLVELVYDRKCIVTNFETQLNEFIAGSITQLKIKTIYNTDMQKIQKRLLRRKIYFWKCQHLDIFSGKSHGYNKFVLSNECYPNVKRLSLHRSQYVDRNFYIDVEKSSSFLKQIKRIDLEYRKRTGMFFNYNDIFKYNDNNVPLPTRILEETTDLKELYIHMQWCFARSSVNLMFIDLNKWILKLEKVEICISQGWIDPQKILTWIIGWGDQIIFSDKTNLRKLTIRLKNVTLSTMEILEVTGNYDLVWYRHNRSEVEKKFELKNELKSPCRRLAHDNNGVFDIAPTNNDLLDFAPLNAGLLMDKMQTDIYFHCSYTDLDNVYKVLALLSKWVMKDVFLNAKSNLKKIVMIFHWPFKDLQGVTKKVETIIDKVKNIYIQDMFKSIGHLHVNGKEDYRENTLILTWRMHGKAQYFNAGEN